MEYCVYILFSQAHDKYYIGQTENFEARIKRHNQGTEKATSPYRPWQTILIIEKPSRSEAMELERKLKNLNRQKLTKFIEKYSGDGPGRSGQSAGGLGTDL